LYSLSERAKLGLLCVLLLLMFGIVAFSAENTLQAAQSLRQQYSAVKAGDVSAIRPWMTIHVISHIYHVPENYLYHSLNIDNPALFRHATLNKIANRKRETVNSVIHSVQLAISAYREAHPQIPTPTPGRSRY
jgi:HAMP domain-containing protein